MVPLPRPSSAKIPGMLHRTNCCSGRQISLPLQTVAVPGECLTTEEQVSREASGTSTFPLAVTQGQP